MARTRVGGDYPALSPIDRPGPLRAGVLEALRDLIVARTLEPGKHLVESELASRLRISRGPVREALQALASEGWVDLAAGRGAFVHVPTEQEVREVFAVRMALESEAARLAARQASSHDVAALREICVRGRSAVLSGDFAQVVAVNSALHLQVARLSGMELLRDHIATLDRRVRWLYQPVVGRRGLASWDEHAQLIEAMERHDTDGAAAVMRAHSSRTLDAYCRHAVEDDNHQVDSAKRGAP